MPRKKNESGESKGPNKTAYVLSMPDLSAKELSATAKTEGIDISEAYVYTIRSAAKRKQGAPKGKPGRPKASTSSSSGSAKASGAEAEVMRLVIEYGAPAVRDLVQRVTERLSKLV